MALETRWLQDFLALADTGHFTRAAAARNTSQAAFSRRIQSLEAWLGVTLVDRSDFPARLTPEGERFKTYAIEILGQVLAARGELSGKFAADHVRIAVPYALATSNLPEWWAEWSKGNNLSCTLTHGNVHDLVASLVGGSVDILTCFQTPQRPIQLNAESYISTVIRTERLRPYASPRLIASGGAEMPGTPEKPVPVLAYSQGVYLSAIVQHVIENAEEELFSRVVIESDMSDVLRSMAEAGYGVAWLPDCTVRSLPEGTLVPIGGDRWSTPISIIAYRERTNDKPSVRRLWASLANEDAEATHVSAA